MSSKKLLVIGEFDFLSDKAHVINTALVAKGFQKKNYRTFFVSYSAKYSKQNSKKFLDEFSSNSNLTLNITKVRNIYPDVIKSIFLFINVFKILKTQNLDYVYCRGSLAALPLLFFDVPFVIESHAHVQLKNKKLFYTLKLLKRRKNFKGLMTLSNSQVTYFSEFKINKNKIYLTSAGIDLDEEVKYLLRKYNGENFCVGYIGKFYQYKGVELILESAKKLSNCNFILVGADEDNLEFTKKAKSINNLKIINWVPRSELYKYINEMDLLVLPYVKEHPSSKWTSPVKLGEYLISKKPILVSDIDAFKNIFRNNEVFFFKSNSTESLVKKINKIKNSPEIVESKIKQCLNLAEDLSIENKCSKIENILLSDV